MDEHLHIVTDRMELAEEFASVNQVPRKGYRVIFHEMGLSGTRPKHLYVVSPLSPLFRHELDARAERYGTTVHFVEPKQVVEATWRT